MKMYKILLTGVVSLFLFAALPAYAVGTDVMINDTVDPIPNELNISGIQITGHYDTDWISDTGPTILSSDPGSQYFQNTFSFTIKLGSSWVFTQADARGGEARFYFVDGSWYGMDFESLLDGYSDYLFTVGGTGTDLDLWQWKISTGGFSNPLVGGDLRVSDVPVPSAIWLLISGLAGLAGLRKKLRLSVN